MASSMERLSSSLSGQYRIERELGAGGMATVYLAEDVKHHRKVAIKVLREDLAVSLGAARFLREIEIAAALQHPNILPLLDSGEVRSDGDGSSLLYFVMPYVAGHSLRERLTREGELPVGEAVRLLTEVVDALAHAHEHGVVHRDIKPDNVMLSGRHALVTDFGVAKAVSEATGRQTLTTLGVALGTPAYMSPEQCTADPHVDHRSDIYSVGALAYELFAGRPPFTGTTPQQVLAAHTVEAPEPVSKHRQGLAPALDAVVMRCLAKRPADRWQSAQELLAQLEPFATPSGGTTPTLTRPVAAVAASRRTPVIAAGIILAAVAVAATMTLARRAPALVTPGAATRVTAEAGLEVFPALSPDGTTIAYAAGSSTEMRIFLRSVGGTRAIPLTDDSAAVQRNPRWSPDGERVLFLSGGAVFAAPKLGGPPQRLIPATPGAAVLSATWSPDGREIAFSRRDSLLVMAAQGGPSRLIAQHRDLQWCAWSRSDLIACAAGNSTFLAPGGTFGNLAPAQIVIVPAQGGQFVAVTDSVALNHSPAWSPDGDVLFFVSSRQGARDVFMQRVTRRGRADGDAARLTVGSNAQTISLSGDGSRLAYASFTHQANVAAIPIPGGAAVSAASAIALTSGSQVIESTQPSRDGRWLLYDSNLHGNADIYRVPLRGGTPERLTTDTVDEFAPDLSPDGREFAFHSFRSGSRDVYVQPIDGGPPRQVTNTPVSESYPRWSPDGSAIAFYEQRQGNVHVVRRQDGEWLAPVVRATGAALTSWSPDGRWLASSRGRALLLIPADSGDARVIYDPRPSSSDPIVRYPHWSQDGRTIYFKSFDARGRSSFWAIPATGGRPRLLVFFDDPTRQSLRNEWSTDGKQIFFTVNDRQSDIWVVELNRP